MYKPLVLGLALAATPALANSHYHAQPAATPAAAKLVLRDTIWSCGDAGCAAPTRSNSRPAIVCELLVKQVGALRSFSVGGEALSAGQLEKCNARAD
jgi:hypothetical protein